MVLLCDSMAINVYFCNCFQPCLLLTEVFTLQNDVALKVLGGSFLACSFQNFNGCLFWVHLELFYPVSIQAPCISAYALLISFWHLF